MIRPQSQRLADRNCGYDTTDTTHRLMMTHAQRMQQAGRSAYTVHLVYSRLGSVVGSRNSKLQPLTAVHPEPGLLATRGPGWQRHRRMQRYHKTCRLQHLFNMPPPRAPVQPCRRTHAGQPAHLRRKTRPLEIPILFPSLLARDRRQRRHKARYPMYRYLPTVFLSPHVRLRNSRLDASVVIKLSVALAHKWLGGHYWGVAHLDGPYRN